MSDKLNWPTGWGTPPERVIEYTNDGKKSGLSVYLGDLEQAAHAAISVTGTPAGTLYGGRSKAAFESDVWLYVDGGKKLNLYGGGNGGTAGAVFLCIRGGSIGTVYGGGRGNSKVDSVRIEISGDVYAGQNITLGGNGSNALVMGDAELTVVGVQQNSAFAAFTKTLNGQYRTTDANGKKVTAYGKLILADSHYTMQGKLKNWECVSLSGSTVCYDRFSGSSASNVKKWDFDDDAMLVLNIRSGVTIKSDFSGSGDILLTGKGTCTFTGDNSGFSGTVTVAAAGKVNVKDGAFFGGSVMLESQARLTFSKGNVVFAGNLTGDASALVSVKSGTVSLKGDNSGFLGEYRIGSRGVLEVAGELPETVAFSIAASNAVLMLTGSPVAVVDETGSGEGSGEGENAEPAKRTDLLLTGNGGTVMLGGNAIDLEGYTGSKLTIYGGGTATASADMVLVGTGSRKQVFRRVVAGGLNLSRLAASDNFAIKADIRSLYAGILIAGSENVAYNKAVVKNDILLTDITAGTIYSGGVKCAASGEFSHATTITGGSVAMLYGAGWENNFSGSAGVTTTVTDGQFKQIYAGGGKVQLTSGTVSLNITGGTVTRLDAGGWHNNNTLATITTEITGGWIKSLYGGVGNQSSLGTVKVGIKGGTVDEIYLGGSANDGSSTAYELNIGENALVTGDIYAAGRVSGYGNSNSIGSITISMDGGLVTGDIYGGAYVTGFSAAGSCSSSNLTITGGTVAGDIYGSGYAGQMAYVYCTSSSAITIGGDALLLGDIYGGGRGKGKFLQGGCSIEIKDVTAESVMAGYTGTINGSFMASNVSTGQKTTGRSKLIFTNYRADFIGTLQNLSSISVSDDSAVVLRWDPSSWKNIDAFETVLGGSLTFAASGDCTIDGGFTGDGALIFAGTVTYTLTSDESAVDGSVTLTDGAELRIKHDSFYSADSFALGADGTLVLLAAGTVAAGISGGADATLMVSGAGKPVTVSGSMKDFAGSLVVSGGTLSLTAATGAEVLLPVTLDKGLLLLAGGVAEMKLNMNGGALFAGGDLAITGEQISGGTIFAGGHGERTDDSVSLTLNGGIWNDVRIFAGGKTAGKGGNTVTDSVVLLQDADFSGTISTGGAGQATVGRAEIVLTGDTAFRGTIRGEAASSTVTFKDFSGRFDGQLISIDTLAVAGDTSLAFEAGWVSGSAIDTLVFSQDGRSAALQDTAMLTVSGGDALRMDSNAVSLVVNVDRFCFASAEVGEESRWLLLTGVSSLSGKSFTVGGLTTTGEDITLVCDGDSIRINDEEFRLIWNGSGLYLCGTIGQTGQVAMHWSSVIDMTGAPLSGTVFSGGGSITAAQYGYSDTAHQISVKAIVEGTAGDVAVTGDVAGSVWLNVRTSGQGFTGISGGTVGRDVVLYFEGDNHWDSLLVAADDAWVTGRAAVTVAGGVIDSMAIANPVEPVEGERTARVASAVVELAGGLVKTLDGAGTADGTELLFSASYDDFSADISNISRVDLAGNSLTVAGGNWHDVGGFDFGGGALIFTSGLDFSAGTVSGRGAIAVKSGDVVMEGDTTGFSGQLTIEEGASFALDWDDAMIFDGDVSGSGDLIALGAGTISLTGDLTDYNGNGFRLGDDVTLLLESRLTGDVRITGGTASTAALAGHSGTGKLTVDGEGTRVFLFGSDDLEIAANNGTLIYGGCATSADKWYRETSVSLKLDDSIFGSQGYFGSFFAGCGKDCTMGGSQSADSKEYAISLILVDGYAFDTVAIGGVDGGSLTGDLLLTMDGGTVNRLVGGGNGGSSEGNLQMTITGGTIGTIYGGDLGKNGRFSGDVTIDLITEKTESEEAEAAAIVVDTIHAGGLESFIDSDATITIRDDAGTIDISGDIWFDNVQFNATINLTASVEDSGFALFGGTIHGWAEMRKEEAIGDRKLNFVKYTTGYAGSFDGFTSVVIDKDSDVTFNGYDRTFRTDAWDIAGKVTFAGESSNFLGVDSDSTPALKGKGDIVFAASMTFGCTMKEFTGTITLETAEEAPLTTVTITKGVMPETLNAGGFGALVFTGKPASLTVKGSFKVGSELYLTHNSATLSGTFGSIALGAADATSSEESVTVTFNCSAGVTVKGDISGSNTSGDTTLHFTGVGILSLNGAIDGGIAGTRTLAFTKYAGTISLDATPVTNFDVLSLANDAALVFTGGTVDTGITSYSFDLTARSAGFASSAMVTFRDTTAFDLTSDTVSITLAVDAAQLKADTAYKLIVCDNVEQLSGRTVTVALSDGTTGTVEIDGDLWYDAAAGCYWQLTTGEDTLSLFMRQEAMTAAIREMSLADAVGGDADDDRSALAGMLA